MRGVLRLEARRPPRVQSLANRCRILNKLRGRSARWFGALLGGSGVPQRRSGSGQVSRRVPQDCLPVSAEVGCAGSAMVLECVLGVVAGQFHESCNVVQWQALQELRESKFGHCFL